MELTSVGDRMFWSGWNVVCIFSHDFGNLGVSGCVCKDNGCRMTVPFRIVAVIVRGGQVRGNGEGGGKEEGGRGRGVLKKIHACVYIFFQGVRRRSVQKSRLGV